MLEIQNLSVHFGDEATPFKAVDRISYRVEAGEVVGLVGESGSGKSVSSLALMGLVDFPGRVHADALRFDGQDLLRMPEKRRRSLIGSEVSMIFQDPMTSLNPCYTVEYQIAEALRAHGGGSRRALRSRVIELLDQVGIPDPESRLRAYPHQLSGGMSQRVMIAMAIACKPRLLIADEPTTALDVTIQAQIMDLLLSLQRSQGLGLVLITHDLALVAEAADRILVMYAGQLGGRPAPRRTSSVIRVIPTPRRCCGRCRNFPGAPSAWCRCKAWSRAATTGPRAACSALAVLTPRTCAASANPD